MLAGLVCSNPNLTTLRVLADHGRDLFTFQSFLDAVMANLVWRESPLRCLEIHPSIHIVTFRALLTAAANSPTLEHLVVRIIHANKANCFQALHEAFPSLKTKDITLEHRDKIQDKEERLFEAVKRNYIVQSLHANNFLLAPINLALISTYLDRNCKLAEWVKNPKMVPRDLWQYAIMLALEAGMNYLYQGLLAISGEGIGLHQQGQKRKRSHCFDPSS